MSFMFLSLLCPLIIGALAFDWSSDNDDDQTPEETGEELSYDGSNLLEGTEGDDTLPSGQDRSLAPDTIHLLGGNDTAFVEVNDITTVSGGDGDDSITATGVLNTLEGDAGNDTLTADDSNRILGGEGDDVLNFTHGSYDQGEEGVVNGGEGDDTINLRADALIDSEGLNNFGGVDIIGGEGADEINIIYELNGVDENRVSADDSITRGFVSISAFTPGEDSLTLEVEIDPAAEVRDVTAELDQTAEGGAYTSVITLTFAATDDTPETTNILTVMSAAPFTLDDIQLVGV